MDPRQNYSANGLIKAHSCWYTRKRICFIRNRGKENLYRLTVAIMEVYQTVLQSTPDQTLLPLETPPSTHLYTIKEKTKWLRICGA